VTGVDINQAVEVLEQNTTHVTVRLYNRWSSCGEVDSIYNQFKKGHFEEVCYEATDVPGGSAYDDLTLQCFHLKPYAQLETCVVDDNGALDPVGDDATVPECCYANTEDKPVVCYKILINCETGCTELVDRRNLRGGV